MHYIVTHSSEKQVILSKIKGHSEIWFSAPSHVSSLILNNSKPNKQFYYILNPWLNWSKDSYPIYLQTTFAEVYSKSSSHKALGNPFISTITYPP